MKTQIARRRFAAQIAIAAMASFAFTGTAFADTDGITKTGQVNVGAHLITCTGQTPSGFSFDISWIDPFDHAYFLADRSHGTTATAEKIGGVSVLTNGTVGDLLEIDINTHTVNAIQPPATDPFAGARCDANTNFGGTTSTGRNEITGPNGVFTVNHGEAWLGDGPSDFDLVGQTNTAADYANDKCDSSVRVFDLVSQQQTDHIDLGGCFRTDEGGFDPVDQVALFANPSEQPGFKIGKPQKQQFPFVTLISTFPKAGSPATVNAHHILKQIPFDGTHGTVLADMGIEQTVYSPKTGYFYVNVPGTTKFPSGVVTVIDPSHDGDNDGDDIHVVRNFFLGGNCAPTGGALGPDFEEFLGCSNGALQVIDIRNGHLIATLAGTSGGCDEVAFNAGDDHFVGACSDSNPPGAFGLDIADADPVRVDITSAQLQTATGAHSVAADPVTVANWVPGSGGACSPTPCVQIYSSTGGDDPPVWVQEAEGH